MTKRSLQNYITFDDACLISPRSVAYLQYYHKCFTKGYYIITIIENCIETTKQIRYSIKYNINSNSIINPKSELKLIKIL